MSIAAIVSPNSVEIAVRSAQRAKVFYSHVFQQMPEFNDAKAGLVLFRLGDKEILLIRNERGDFLPADTQISLLVEDISYEYQRLQQIPNAQIAALTELMDDSYSMVVCDPDGNRLEVRSFDQTIGL